MVAFFQSDQNHASKLCKKCIKLYKELKNQHMSIQTCQQHFNRHGMDTICKDNCSFTLFSKFTYSDVTKSLHGSSSDFHEIRRQYPATFEIDSPTDADQGLMTSFSILGRKCHGFICRNCEFIKISKVRRSKLRKPNHYHFNHVCDSPEEEMATQSSCSQSSNFPTSQSSNFPPSDMASSQSSSSQLRNIVEEEHNMEINSIQSRNESGYQTPDITLHESLGQSNSFQCSNKFIFKMGDIQLSLDCEEQFDSESAVNEHKNKCPIRYKSGMNTTNPGYLAKMIWNFSKKMEIADYLANDLNQDLFKNEKIPGFIAESDELLNVKKCRIFRLSKLCNFIVAHCESHHTPRKNKDIFEISTETCQQLIGSTSSVNKFGKLSQTLGQHNLPRPAYLADKIRDARKCIHAYTTSEKFDNMKRTNNSKKGLCYGSKLTKSGFSEYLDRYEEKHPEILRNTVALVGKVPNYSKLL